MRPYRSTSLPMLRIISLCACLITVSALFLPDWLPESRRTFEQSIRHRLAAALETEHDSWAYARPWRQSHHEATEDEMEERTAGFVDQRHRPIVFAAPSMQKRKVNITLGVMASCPDAELCEQIFDKVLDRVSDLAEIELSYIATVNFTEPTIGMTCKHGAKECLANIHQLCVKEAYPDHRVWFQDFISCVNWGPDQRIGDEKVAKECAKLAGIDWERDVAPCVAHEGPDLLRASAERSAALGISRSCSILFNERLICVHDGRWIDCDRHDVSDFVARVRKEYDRAN